MIVRSPIRMLFMAGVLAFVAQQVRARLVSHARCPTPLLHHIPNCLIPPPPHRHAPGWRRASAA
jgi:hypothetical protein